MRNPTLIVLLFTSLALLSGCKKQPAEVEIDQTRGLTTEDASVRLNASSWQRFRPGERQYFFERPNEWRTRPATQLRRMNFVAGAMGEVEIYLSETMGGLGENVNRWRRQFGQEMLGESQISQLPRVLALGASLVLVEAQGTYAPGMGRPEQPGFALIGVIGASSSGVITVKMVGPQAAVEAERERFLAFCRSLTLEG
jgi:hypothetical protein